MKKIVLIIVMSVMQTVAGIAQIPYPSTDTLPCGERQRDYFYSEWYDTVDFYLRPDCYSYSSADFPNDFCSLQAVSEELPGYIRFFQQYAPRRLRIKGLWAMVRQYGLSSYNRIKDSTRLPEYLYLGLRTKDWPYPYYNTYDDYLEFVDSVRWDTAQPKMMCVMQTADGRKRNFYCHVYEVLFDTVYTISGEFWIGGSNNSNVHTGLTWEHWPTFYVAHSPFWGLFGEHIPNLPYYKDRLYRVRDGLWHRGDEMLYYYGPFGVILDEPQYLVKLLSDDAARGIAKHTAYYPAGSHQTITAVASPCYRFSHWSDGDTTNPRTILVTQDTTITAYFDTVANIYEVAARSNDLEMGRAVLREWPICDSTPRNIDPDNPTFTQDSLFFPEYRVIGTDTAYCEGDSAIFWARPKFGSYFWYWNDSVRENPRTILVTQDTVLTAIFKREAPPAYVRPCPRVRKPLAVVLDTGHVQLTWGWGRNVLHQSWDLAWGLAGTPPDSCEIIHCRNFDWEIDGLDTGVRYAAYVRGWCQTNTEQYYYSDWSDSVEIYFPDVNRYTVTVAVDYQERGRVYGGGEYDEGSVAMLTANAWNPYSFSQWNDGDTANPRYVVVTQDTSFTAQFVEPEPPEGVATADGAGSAFKLLPNPASGSVLCVFDREAIAGGVLAMTDATGRELMRHELAPLTASLRLDLSALPAGTYFVTLATPQGSSTQKLILE